MKKENKKTKLNKKHIIVGLVLIILIFALGVFYLYKKEQTLKNPINIKLSKEMTHDKVFNGLKITKINGFKLNDCYKMSFIIKNESVKDYENSKIKLVFIDSNGFVKEKIDALIPKIQAGSSVTSTYVLRKERLKDYTFLIINRT